MSYFNAVRFVDELGAAYGIRQINNKPFVTAMPYPYDVARGFVSGHTPWTKIGYTPSAGTADSDVWSLGGLINFPAAAAGVDVVSTDPTNDLSTPALRTGTSTAGSATALTDTTGGVDFTAATAVAIGDCVILDKSGAVPEWGWVTAVAAQTLTVAGGFSSGGTGALRAYAVLDYSATAGAHAVLLEYLTGAYAEKTEICILNGTTVVHTVNLDIFRINGFRMIAAGVNNKPSGALSVRILAAATPVYSNITLGYTRARNSAYTVPTGKTLYVTSIRAGCGFTGNGKTEYCRLFTRANREPKTNFLTGNIFYPYTEIISSGELSVQELPCPTKLVAKTDIKIGCIASAAGFAVSTLRGWLE